MFGNEGTGLVNEEIAICDFLISIPTSKKYAAMNISHAVAVILYELYKQTGKNKINSHINHATRKEMEVILDMLDNIIDSIEFSTKEKKETQKAVWKSVFEKSMMTKREAFTIIGLLRKIGKS